MQKFNAIILEDTFNDQLAIEMILSEFSQIEATYVNSPKAFLQAFSKQTYQLFIVDIMLNDSLTGIDVIHSISNPAAWVIISSSMDCKDYFEEYRALKFNKFFIKKPIDEFIFKTNIESFLLAQQHNIPSIPLPPHNDFVMLKQGNYLYKILCADILLIETTDHATTVFTETNKYTTYTTLKTFEELLKNWNFEKVNRNSLVNMNAIKRFNVKENYIEIDKFQVSVSRSNRQLFIERFEDKSI
jgi:DNA-binding LytR/AlgR family response regulator